MKKKNPPKDVAAAVRAAARLEEISNFGRIISFRTLVHKNKKKYNRKSKHGNDSYNSNSADD